MIFSVTKRLQAEMAAATSYEEWAEAAKAYDEKSGVMAWKTSDESKHFDYASIRRRLERLRRLRKKRDNAGVLFALNEGIHGNIDGMGRRALYGKSKFGTKQLIVERILYKGGAGRYFQTVQRAAGAYLQHGVCLVQDFVL